MEKIIKVCRNLDMNFFEGSNTHIKCYNHDKTNIVIYNFKHKFLFVSNKVYHEDYDIDVRNEILLKDIDIQGAVIYLKGLQ